MSKNNQLMINFGERLRFEREKQNLTRISLAKLADTTQDYIAQLERGDKSPSIQMLYKILLALNISADLLIFGTSKEGIDELINDFVNFLKKRSYDEVDALYKIAKYLLKYIEHA